MAEPRLQIATMEARVTVPAEARHALEIRCQAEEILGAPLRSALGEAARHRLGGPGIAVINKLEIGVSLEGGEDPHEAARRWAKAILKGIRRAAAAPDRMFADQAEYLACYMEAALAGRRGDAAFRVFAGFQAMPGGMAIRAALATPGAPALAALSRLSPRTLDAVLAALDEADVTELLEALARASPDRRFEIALSAEALFAARKAQSCAEAALRLVVLGAGVRAGAKTQVTLELAQSFAAAVRRSGSQSSRDADNSPIPPNGQSLATLPASLLAALNSAEAGKSVSDRTPWASPVAALALLLLHLIARLDGGPGAAPNKAAARGRFDIMVRASGDLLAATDPVFRKLCGLPPHGPLPMSDPALLVALAPEDSPDPIAALSAAVLHDFAKTIRGFEGATEDFLRANFLLSPGRLEEERNRLHLFYTPPPVHVALQLAGIDRPRLTLPWLECSRLDLTSEYGP